MNQLNLTAEYLKALAHPKRLLILRALRRHQQLSVSQLVFLCRTSQPLISNHLRLMKDRGLLHKRRQGRQVFYLLSETALAHLADWFGQEYDYSGDEPSSGNSGNRTFS